MGLLIGQFFMIRKHWDILLGTLLLPAVLLLLGWWVFIGPTSPEEKLRGNRVWVAAPTIAAEKLIEQIEADLEEAQEKHLGQWLRLRGKVRLILLVEDADEPFTMVELEAPEDMELKAAFPGAGPPTLEIGGEAVIEGQCRLLERNVVYLERGRLVSFKSAAEVKK